MLDFGSLLSFFCLLVLFLFPGLPFKVISIRPGAYKKRE